MNFSMENLNTALVHEWITNVAGAERTLLSLKEIFPDAPIYTAIYDPKKALPFNKFKVITSFLQKIPLMKSKRELMIPFTPFAFEQFDLSKFNLVISSSTMAAKGVITKPDTVHISYCHTPPRYLWEPSTDPRARAGRFRWLRENTIHKMRIWDRVVSDRVDYYIANSKYVATRIKKYYGRDATVIYPPVNVEQFTSGDISNVKDYFLYVSRLVDYKRCDIVVEAFNKLGLSLKIVGKGPAEKQLKKIASKNIVFLGHISDKEMKKYYAEAKALVFAAEEDFGIVPVEAMACGRPVIAYKRGGAVETVVEGVSGTFFNQQTSQSIVEVVSKFDHTKYDPAEIRRHAEKFSAERFKQEILAEIKRILELENTKSKERS